MTLGKHPPQRGRHPKWRKTDPGVGILPFGSSRISAAASRNCLSDNTLQEQMSILGSGRYEVFIAYSVLQMAAEYRNRTIKVNFLEHT
jgi:hypothetical protein